MCSYTTDQLAIIFIFMFHQVIIIILYISYTLFIVVRYCDLVEDTGICNVVQIILYIFCVRLYIRILFGLYGVIRVYFQWKYCDVIIILCDLFILIF